MAKTQTYCPCMIPTSLHRRWRAKIALQGERVGTALNRLLLADDLPQPEEYERLWLAVPEATYRAWRARQKENLLLTVSGSVTELLKRDLGEES